MPTLFHRHPVGAPVASAPESNPGAKGSPKRPLFLRRGEPLTGSKTELVRGLDTFAAASIIMGIVIGAGIFRTPNVVADIAGASGLIFVAFLLAGLLVMLGALCFAELGAMLPKSGGYYVYLQKAFGDMPAFLLGWSAFLMIQGAGMAAVAVFLGELGGILFGYGAGPGVFTLEIGSVVIASPPFMVSLVAAGAIVLLGLTNTLGVRLAGHVQVSFAVFKISALIAVIVVGIYFGRGEPLTLTPVFPTSWDFNTLQIVGLAMIPALFTYSGWVNANTVAEEIQDVEKTLPRAIIMAVTVIIAIYLVTNFAYLWAIGLEGVAQSEAGVAADVFTAAFGDSMQIGNWSVAPGAVITLIIFMSLFGSLNGMSLAYPRMYYAMAKSGVFFKNAARTHPRFKTPHLAIALQVVWVTILVFSGTFERLLEFVVVSSFVFFTLTVIALIVLRINRPDLERPFKVPFYPVVPLLFILGSTAVLINQVLGSPVNSLITLVLIALGVPVFYLWRRFGTGPMEPEEDEQAGEV